jgi:hypothetical protein
MKETRKVLEEGTLTNKWSEGRFNANKNGLIVVTGGTGSGKTYSALKFCECWYKYKFNEPFPIENVCFSLEEVARRLKDRKLRKCEYLILEEAGANLGAADFQMKISKIFTYILQSFRSMNIGLVLTLPVLTMLNKSARQLIHMHLTTSGIVGGKCNLKVKIHQLNQHSGKSYWKRPHINNGGMSAKVDMIAFTLCSKELRDAYEKKKSDFVYKLVDNFEDNVRTKEEKNKIKDESLMQAREKYIDKRRDKKGRLRCEKCNSLNVYVNTERNEIMCSVCKHAEKIVLK